MRILALLLALTVSGCVDAHPKDAALRLEFDRGVCSGTAVAADVILSAEHCWAGNRRLMKINGQAVHALEIVKDGNDHVLVRVTVRFNRWARMGPAPMQADRLRWFGNPAGEADVLRDSYVARVNDKEIWIDAHSFGGDSGSGMFNAQGQVVAVLSAGKLWSTPNGFTFAMTVAYPLAFSAAQWREIRD